MARLSIRTGTARISRRSGREQTEKRIRYNWRSDTSWFPPGYLEYQIYTDLVLDIGRSDTLFTPNMSPAKLAQHGLLGSDSLASDHLLFIVDVRPPQPQVSGDVNGVGVVDVSDLLILVANWGPCPPERDCAQPTSTATASITSGRTTSSQVGGTTMKVTIEDVLGSPWENG
jgi:hypothetical protein